MVDSRKDAVRWPGVGSGLIWPGHLSLTNGSQVGDAFLLDLKLGLFAVADSPERSPEAAVRFLTRLSTVLRKVRFDPHVHDDEWPELKRWFIGTAERVLQQTPKDEICTFTGVCVVDLDGLGQRAILLHLGDSALWTWRPESGEWRQLTHPNFWMVGRTRNFYQVEEILVEHDAVFVLGSDGFKDRFITRKADLQSFLAGIAEASLSGCDAGLDE